MRSRPNNLRGDICAGLAAVILSLGAADRSLGQMISAKSPEPPKKTEGMASWYTVPLHSRTKERAGKGELTAANNRFPLGTKVRVTHLANKKSVDVRITDRGVYKHGIVIDLCKEAAEKLDMLREGSARVQLEVLPEDKPSTAKTWPW